MPELKIAENAKMKQGAPGIMPVAPFLCPEKKISLDKSRIIVPNSDFPPQGERQVLQKRARRKAVGFPLARRLLKVENVGDMKKSYERQLSCGETMLQKKTGELKSYYCRNRSCIQCAGIRTGQMISSYGEEVMSWKKKYLVTLTIKNVERAELRSAIKKMSADFRVVVKHLNYHWGKVKLVRSTEITYNEEMDNFHPHMHLIVEGYEPARALMKHWVKITGGSILAQDLRKADENSVLELFKYATKLVSEGKDEHGNRKVVPAQAMHDMFSAIKGLRLISAVGFKAKKEVQEEGDLELQKTTRSPTRIGDEVTWEWGQEIIDWIDYATGEVLADYQPTPRAREFIRQLQNE
jgi:hypothetical protein